MVQRFKTVWLWLTAAALLVAGCTPSPPTPEASSSAQLVAVFQAASADAVTGVLVTVTAPDMDPVTGSLTKTGATWGGTLTQIPPGTSRTFTAEAFDTTGKKLFAGQAPGVTLTAGGTAMVSITLQETTPTPGFENDAPRITALVASSNRVTVGGTVSLQVTASDPNPADTLGYAWTASAGSLSSTTLTSTTWTAPALPGSATVTVTVTDPHGASAALSVTLQVETAGGTDGGTGASASVGALLNTWPQVNKVTAAPSFVAMGETTSVEATATDLDGDTLAYSWTSTECFGTWTGQATRTPTFTPTSSWPSPGPDGCAVCQLRVTVTDGRGGQTTGTLRMCVGTRPSPSFPPRFSSTTQSATAVATGATVTFRVTASDPLGSALSFQWHAARGTLGAPLTGVASSEVVWTAPSCVPSTGATARVSSTVKNPAGLSAAHTFAVNLTGPACPPSLWASGGALGTARVSHTATRLASGQVLVAGGQGDLGSLPTTELYDPVSGLWAPGVSMSLARTHHSATALPSGKVLVAGGRGSGSSTLASTELYDPATRSWTLVASMTRPRANHAAALLASGKVLVTGGAPGGPSLADAEVYDPTTDTWTPVGSMLQPRAGHPAILLPNGKVMVGGNGGFELFDPATGSWSAVGPFPGYFPQPVLALLPSNKVLVADLNTLAAALYDPAAGTSVTTGGLSAPRPNTSLAVLGSGKVLLAGGGDLYSDYQASTQLYDPVAGSWSSAGTMSQGRIQPTATVLSSGEVLIVGGWTSSAPGGSPVRSNTADLYLP